MPALIYIHGFLSSPSSHKALQVKQWLADNRPDIDYHCPFLTVYPDEVKVELDTLVQSLLEKGPVYLMGSSMGGFWSTYLAETYKLPAVLINPAVKPSMLMPSYVGMKLKNYHTDDSYMLEQRHIDQLRELVPSAILHPQLYWVLLQTADETLDYRLAQALYGDAKLLIEEGGDHGFVGFERHIPASIEFLESQTI